MIDRAEFKKVMTWMRAQTRVGKSHTHGLRTGLGVSKDIDNAGMVEFFFGTNGNRQLPLTQFERFLKELHEEVRWFYVIQKFRFYFTFVEIYL